MWLHSLKVAQLLRSAACLHTDQSRSYLNHLLHSRQAWSHFILTSSGEHHLVQNVLMNLKVIKYAIYYFILRCRNISNKLLSFTFKSIKFKFQLLCSDRFQGKLFYVCLISGFQNTVDKDYSILRYDSC